MISIRNINPEEKNFHNTRIKVYPRTLKLEEISYWPENDRTILQFDILSSELKKPLAKINLENLIEFLAKQKVLEIPRLAESIKNNDLKVPLVILEDGKLLDGNRRYFACYYLKLKAEENNEPRPSILDRIPVWVIRNRDIDERNQLKILAEANFVYPNKVDWPLDVKAKVINKHYRYCIKNGMSPEEAFNDIKDVYSVEKQQARDYIDTMRLASDFIKSEKGKLRRNELRSIVQHKFLYFWEFKNKAAGLKNKDFKKVKELFFIVLKNGQLNNYKLIEPMIWSIQDEDEWEVLTKSEGAKLQQIEAWYKETKAVRSAEDKIENFIKWITKKSKRDTLTGKTYELLEKLSNAVAKILSKRKRS